MRDLENHVEKSAEQSREGRSSLSARHGWVAYPPFGSNGKWSVECDSGNPLIPNAKIATVYAGKTYPHQPDRAWEHAHLIAAAPDMLAALKDCADLIAAILKNEGGFAIEEILDDARAAIAKATFHV